MSASSLRKSSTSSLRLTILFLFLLATPLQIVLAEEKSETESELISSDEQLLKELKAAWQERTEKFDSVKFEWDEEREYHMGSIIPGPFAKEHKVPNVHPILGFPIATTTTKFPCEVVLQGSWMRHACKSVGPSNDGSTIRQTDHLAVYDGTSSRMMSVDGKQIRGSIRDENQNADAGSAPLLPLLYFMRPSNPRNGKVKPASLKVVSRDQEDGTVLVEANSLKRFVVDPRRGFIVLHWEIGNPINGGNLYEGDIEYEQHESLGWVPKTWKTERYDTAIPSLLLEKDEATITHLEAGQAYERSLFRVEFPLGSEVWNARIRKQFVVMDKDDPRIAYESP